MRAVVVRTAGGPEAVEIVEAALPEPAAGQVRIKVAATALNPMDEVVRAGLFGSLGDGVGLGWDIAGTVDAVGADAPWNVGDEVVALHYGGVKPLGAHAQYAVVDADAAAQAPSTVDAVAAATLPLNALSADQALDLLGLERGQSLLVTGAAGAVGGFAVQLAARRGLEVTALAREGDRELLLSLGAAHFTADGVEPGSVDGVLDTALLGEPALEWVRDGGVYIGLRPQAHPESVRGVRTGAVSVTADGARLARLARLVDEGVLRLRVAESYPLTESVKAHERRAEGGLRGAVVLVP